MDFKQWLEWEGAKFTQARDFVNSGAGCIRSKYATPEEKCDLTPSNKAERLFGMRRGDEILKMQQERPRFGVGREDDRFATSGGKRGR